jgi:hypothetical protein
MQKTINHLIYYHHSINCEFDINETRQDETLSLKINNSIIFSKKINDNIFECRAYVYYVCELCEKNGKVIDWTLPFLVYFKFLINKNSYNYELLTDEEKIKLAKEKSFQIRNYLFENLIIEPIETKFNPHFNHLNKVVDCIGLNKIKE